MKEKLLRFFLAAAAMAAVIAAFGIRPAFAGAEDESYHGDPPPCIQCFDTDEDGLVSADEFPGADQDFSRLDINADGYIDASEAQRRPPHGKPDIKEILAEFDADGDGLLSGSEFPGPADLFDHLDADGDGFLNVLELLDGNPGPPPGNGFEDDDIDQDGRVSREEFSGPADHFDHLDLNGDGYITRAEVHSMAAHDRL